MRRLLLPILTLVVLAVAACQEEENADSAGTETAIPGGIDLAAFAAWPGGSVDEATPEALGQDNILFVVDRSGSMGDPACGGGGSKSSVVAAALAGFIPQIPNDIAVGYLDFGDNTAVRVPLGLNNRTALVAAAEAHEANMGGTDVGEATMVAIQMLADQALLQGSTGTYRIVLIVDGGASDGRRLNQAIESTFNTPVEIMTAGFCIGAGHALNQPGDTVYVEAGNVEALTALLEQAVQAEAPVFTGFVATPQEGDTN